MLTLRYGGISSSSSSTTSHVVMLKKSSSSGVVGVVVNSGNGDNIGRRWYHRPSGAGAAAAAAAAAAMMLSTAAWGIEAPETLSNVPQTLSGECPSVEDCRKARIQRPKSRKAESCTIKCVTTCIRGGEGSPGEGPFNIRRPLVVFKQGFRSRQYCLVECSDICNLIGDGDDGP